ncbi:hypothetical protein [Pseudoxanthomonas putridarboris]|uniref:Uncharacterized protein n=1 Tax=Pseudoxanthomonas putridarboris TaxID=752605 RepID=A0ABU9IYQ3_9GAMM
MKIQGRRAILALAAAMAPWGAAQAIEVENLDGFEEHFDRYAPGGDCSRQPQVVVGRDGFAFEGGPALPKATRPEYAASFMGNFYEGISLAFFPYPAEPRPFLLRLNADEKKGVMKIEVYDFDYAGGPKLPDKYRPYIAGSPYLKCK